MTRTELINKVMVHIKLLDTEKKNQLIESMFTNMPYWPIRMIAIELGLKVED